MKSLRGQARIDHIAEQRKRAEGYVQQLATKLAMQLSYYEVFDLMINAIEDRALCSVEEIRIRAAHITVSCNAVTEIEMVKHIRAVRELEGKG